MQQQGLDFSSGDNKSIDYPDIYFFLRDVDRMTEQQAIDWIAKNMPNLLDPKYLIPNNPHRKVKI